MTEEDRNRMRLIYESWRALEGLPPYLKGILSCTFTCKHSDKQIVKSIQEMIVRAQEINTKDNYPKEAYRMLLDNLIIEMNACVEWMKEGGGGVRWVLRMLQEKTYNTETITEILKEFTST